MALDNVEWKVELIEGFTAKFEIAELDVSRPDTDVQLFRIEVLDVHAQKAVEQVGDETLKHGGGKWPLPGPGMDIVQGSEGI